MRSARIRAKLRSNYLKIIYSEFTKNRGALRRQEKIKEKGLWRKAQGIVKLRE
jgi:hypothetical protein